MTELQAWAESFADAQREPAAIAAFVDRTVHKITDGVPEMSDDLLPLVMAAVRQHWQAFLDQFFAPVPFELVPAARRLPAEIARRHLGLPVLLALYRQAQESSWEFATSVVREAPGDVDHEALLVWIWTRASDWFSASVDQSVLLHQQEASRVRQHGDTHRYEAVVAALEGGAEEPAALSAALDGYPVSGTHLALIARAVTADAIPQLEPALSRVIAAAGRGHAVIVRPGGRELWAWVPAGDVARLAAARPDPASVRITAGGPAEGLSGFAAAHGDARAAMTVALAPGRCEAVTVYAEVAPLILLSADPRAAERFARRTLRGLADPAADRLRETVRAVLCGDEGADAVAASLGVHKNTVRYRVAQAERLLGVPARKHAGHILLALDYYDTFLAGPEVRQRSAG